MKLANPTWAVVDRQGRILARLYHYENALPEARYQARKLDERVAIHGLDEYGRVLAPYEPQVAT